MTKPTCVHLAPQRKISLRQELYDIVYERTHQHFNESIDALRAKNMTSCGYSWDGFTYDGVYYGQPIGKIQWPSTPMTPLMRAQYMAAMRQQQLNFQNQKLHPSLVPEMEALLAERNRAEKVEGVMVMSTLGSVLNTTGNFESLKKLLPQLLHNHLDEEAAKCDCVAPRLSDEEIEAVLAKHGKYINKIRQRQLLYLLQP